MVRVAAQDMRSGKTPLQQLAEGGVVFDEDELFERHAARDKRLGYRSSAGPQLDNQAVRRGVDATRHGAGQKSAGGGDRACGLGRIEPRTDEARLVGEALLELGADGRHTGTTRVQRFRVQDLSAPRPAKTRRVGKSRNAASPSRNRRKPLRFTGRRYCPESPSSSRRIPWIQDGCDARIPGRIPPAARADVW